MSNNRPPLRPGVMPIVALVIAAAIAGPATAKTVNAIDACNQRADRHLQIEGCTALIERGAVHDRDRTTALQLRGEARRAIRQFGSSFRDYAQALQISPDNVSVRAGLILVADELNRQCSPWPAAGQSTAAIDACTAIIDHGVFFYKPESIARRRVDRGLLLKEVGRTAEAIADFRIVAAASSGADPGDRTRAEEEIARSGPAPRVQ